ncbi:MAG: hypothetical protein CW338_01515 [Clostridiales bacterium]|nr:hypothetical protein [Clostridiales bacterium]
MIYTHILSCDHTPIPAGRRGENAARQIRFSLREWLPLPEDAVITLLVRRPGEEAPYPVPLTSDSHEEGCSMLWTPSAADTALAGTGECELRLCAGEGADARILKSRRYPFSVEDALGQETDPPSPWQPWVDRVCGAADRAEDAARILSDAAEQTAENTADIAELTAAVSRKADAAGLCAGLTAGSALRLIDPDAEPSLWRLGAGPVSAFASLPGSGHRKAAGHVTAILGRTCVKNQMYNPQSGVTSTAGGVTYTNNRDGTWTLTGTGTGTNRKQIMSVSCTEGHVYYASHGAGFNGNGTFYLCLSRSGTRLTTCSPGDGHLLTAEYAYDALSIRTTADFRAPESGLTLRPVLVDVTVLCGAGNEPRSTGELLRQFPGIRGWSYDAGSLMHASAACLKSTGEDLFDAASGTARLFAGETFRISGSWSALMLENIPVTPAADGTFTAGITGTLRVTDGEDILLRRAGNGGEDAEEPRRGGETVLPLPVSRYFPQGMMSCGEVRDELRADRAIRRCEVSGGAVTAMAVPVVTVISPPLSLLINLDSGGQIEAAGEEGGTPSAPLDVMMSLTPDVIRAAGALPRAYVSLGSLDGLLALLGAQLGVTFTRSWDSGEGKWTFGVT